MKRLALIFIAMLLYCTQFFAQNAPKKFQYNYQNYETLPGDLEGGYAWEDAKSACANLTAFGKKDWYLPSKAELEGLYKRKDELGGFTDDWYWSSSEYETGSAWIMVFSDGSKYHLNELFNIRVRCVRKY